MTIVQSKVQLGTLLLGDERFECQITAIKIEPEYDSSGDAVETLCGDKLGEIKTRADKLTFTAIQDFDNPDGLVNWSWDHDLEIVPFVWRPNTGDYQISGTTEVQAFPIGGTVAERLTDDAEWDCFSPTRGPVPPPGPPTGTSYSGAATEVYFTPGGSTVPADLAALIALGALGETGAWVAGAFITLADASQAAWDGTDWVEFTP